MSFSSRVKEDLTAHMSKQRHCRVAELKALIAFSGRFYQDSQGGTELVVTSDSPFAPEKVKMLLKDLYRAEAVISPGKNYRYELVENEKAVIRKIQRDLADNHLDKPCCRQAYIRGAFLAGGSINDPNKNYHIEILTEEEDLASQLQEFLQDYEIESKVLKRTRKNRTVNVLYIKDSERIVDTLSVMKAHRALLELENVRIMKDMRNKVNRQVNCETANLNKTVNASVRQIEDIEYLMEKGKLGLLPPELKEMAMVRLENANTPLKDLGSLVDPPVSKSGVYHRLSRISEIAKRLRENE